jgi:hypothetical protein
MVVVQTYEVEAALTPVLKDQLTILKCSVMVKYTQIWQLLAERGITWLLWEINI